MWVILFVVDNVELLRLFLQNPPVVDLSVDHCLFLAIVLLVPFVILVLHQVLCLEPLLRILLFQINFLQSLR
jgi:hypothetical protein